MGPYYVAALVSLLGPIRRVAAVGRGVGEERVIGSGPRAGQTIEAAVPTTVVGALEFASGAVGSLTASFDVVASEAPHLEIHGSAGSLQLGDPNTFDGPVRLRPRGADGWQQMPLRADGTVGRGIGLADLITGLRAQTPHRASAAFAFHVLDVLLGLERAVASARWEPIDSTTDRPTPLP